MKEYPGKLSPSGNYYYEELDLQHYNFAGRELGGASFQGSDLRNADFTNAYLYWARFMDADLRCCSFVGADMRGALLWDTNLAEADFSNADFSLDNVGGFTDFGGLDLSTCKLIGTKLQGASYDQTTKFPEGFDPQAHGMVEYLGEDAET